ncbi:MAG: hypothetical protein PHH44_05220 [bacterium]|nr:hypothetical protein [bacterium]
MGLLAVKENIKPDISKSGLDWRENIAVQKLLDVVVSIIAEEYIQIAKKNPEVFTNNQGGVKCE